MRSILPLRAGLLEMVAEIARTEHVKKDPGSCAIAFCSRTMSSTVAPRRTSTNGSTSLSLSLP